jgi:hypothetical protein
MSDTCAGAPAARSILSLPGCLNSPSLPQVQGYYSVALHPFASRAIQAPPPTAESPSP